MTKYLIERKFHVGEDQMENVGRRSKQLVQEQFPEITWHHSHVVVDESGNVRTYCVYDAPNEDVVRSHAEQLGLHDVAGVYEIAGDVTPDDFPL
ncbi:MAG: DUF4242 domain-containing protein [Actinobacteria bacterium]|nr:MAG: DUF4242 domain-containing protein [Actinomycetota bacterium]